MDSPTVAELEKLAESIKNEGNKLYKENKLKLAIEKYDLAVKTLPPGHIRGAVFLCNKSMCSLKLEEPGQAMIDSQNAIKIDPKNIKAYYRMAIAYYALNKLKDAIQTLKVITNTLKIKSNKDVNEKLKLLKKIQKERNFLKAIEYEDETDQLDPESLSIPSSYQGPILEENQKISLDWVMNMVDFLKKQKKLHKKFVWFLIRRMISVLDQEPNLNFLSVKDEFVAQEMPEGVENEASSFSYVKYDDVRYTLPKITVCGDIHGKPINFRKFIKNTLCLIKRTILRFTEHLLD